MALYIARMLDGTDFGVLASLSDFGGIDDVASRAADPSVCVVGAQEAALPGICAKLRAQFPSTRIILVDAGEAGEMGRIARETGMDGCLSLDLPPDLLLSGLSLVAAGTRCFPHDGCATAGATAPAPIRYDRQVRADDRAVTLTPRENAVLSLIGEGMANKVIARELAIAESTVKAHLNAVLRKTGTSNRTQAARWAYMNGQFG